MRKKSTTSSQQSQLGIGAVLNGELHELLRKTTLHRAKLAAELSSTDLFVQSIRTFALASGVSLEPQGEITSSRKRTSISPVPTVRALEKTARKKKSGAPIPAAVRAAVAAQVEPWSYINIRAHMDEHAPAISKKVDGARLSQELYAARKAGLIEIHKQGPAGGSHIYVTLQQAG